MADKSKIISSPYVESKVSPDGIDFSNGHPHSVPEEPIVLEQSSELVIGSQDKLSSYKVRQDKTKQQPEEPIVTIRKSQGRNESLNSSDGLHPLLLPTLDPASTASMAQQGLGKGEEGSKDMAKEDMDIDLATKDGHPPNLDSESGESSQDSSSDASPHPIQSHNKPAKVTQHISRQTVPESHLMYSVKMEPFYTTKKNLLSGSEKLNEVTNGEIPGIAKNFVSIIPSSYSDAVHMNIVNSHIYVELIGEAWKNHQQKLTSYTLVVRSNVIAMDNPHMKISPKETYCAIDRSRKRFTTLLALERDLLRLAGDDLKIEYDISLQPTNLYQVADEGEFAHISLARE